MVAVALSASATDSSRAYLLGRLAVIELLVRAAVENRQSVDDSTPDGFRGLYVSAADARRLLDRPDAIGIRSGPAGHDLSALVESEADASGVPVRLRLLADRFGLSPTETDTLLVALAPDLDPRFEKLYGFLHDDVSRRRASIGLALELLGADRTDPASRGAFAADGALVRCSLVLVEDVDRPYLTRSLRVPDRVAAYLLGDDTVDAGLAPWVRVPTALACVEGETIARALDAGVRLIHCREPAASWASSITAGALGGTACLTVMLPEHDDAVEHLVVTAEREATLSGRVLVIGPVERFTTNALRRSAIAQCPTVLYGHAPWDPERANAAALAIDLTDATSRLGPDAWTSALGGSAPVEVSAFRLAPEQIERAVRAATSLSTVAGKPLDGELLQVGARMQNATGLGRLARRISPDAGWTDLVLPPPAEAALRQLADRVRWRSKVMDEWGMRRSGGRGEGVTALFAGEPGTGKTLAAEVVAGDLGLDLYVIDLAAVVDKYIGETEKNLERIFAGAEGVNGVLFFDEADALFGKRSGVRDAHDRYANIETSYLLQRMESFDGIAILATNLGANLDDAFARRLSAVIEFPRPGVEERKRLWACALAGLPVSADVDPSVLAADFDLTGGEIRSAAVTAGYLAAGDRTGITGQRVKNAVHQEFRKLGWLAAP